MEISFCEFSRLSKITSLTKSESVNSLFPSTSKNKTPYDYNLVPSGKHQRMRKLEKQLGRENLSLHSNGYTNL